MGFIDNAVNSNDKLKRGQVWCLECGRTIKINSAGCLTGGWPKCCGYTMSLDSPEELEANNERA